MGDIIERLLTIGVADQDSSIRSIVLSSFDDRFVEHLSQQDNIRAILVALNDEIFSIRELAMMLIGRLAFYLPSLLLPHVRKILLQLLTELEYSPSPLHKEEAARLLGILVSRSKHLVRPYIEPILKVLIPKTVDVSSGVLAKILVVIGELAMVGGPDMVPHVEILMPIIIQALKDQTNISKREAALKALGQLCQSTCWVVEPYLKYPNLLNLLIQILKSENSPSIRHETVRVMGILGAVDPYQHKVSLRSNLTASFQIASLEVGSSNTALKLAVVLSGIGPSSEDFYPTVSISALVKMLEDSSLGLHHVAVVQAIMFILKGLGEKCVAYLPEV